MRLVTPLILICLLALGTGNSASAQRAIVLQVDELGFVTDGRDSISSDEIADYIRDRLFNHYRGTDKMYDRIELQRLHGGPMPQVEEILLKEIRQGQKLALLDLCLHKYRKGFDDLQANQQAKIRKKFPVLFQEKFD